MEEKEFTAKTFEGEVELLTRFGMRSFYYKVSLPRPILVDNLYPDLISILVKLVSHQVEQREAIAQIGSIKSRSSSFPDFQRSLDIISDKIQNAPNPSKFLWELTSDFVHFYHEFLKYMKSSLDLLQKKDEEIEEKLNKVDHFLETIEQNKVEKVRQSKPISFNLTDPKVGEAFNQFVTAQSTMLPRCAICREPATWFAYPCSHPLYCDIDYEEVKNEPDELCPICQHQIEKIVNIPID